MNRKSAWPYVAILIAAIFGVAYAASPYLAVHNLRSAVKTGDEEKLERMVDFPTVREGLKSQLKTRMMKAMQDDPELAGNPFAGIAVMMVPTIVDNAIEAYVTPDGMAAMLNAGKPAGVGAGTGAHAKTEVNIPNDEAKVTLGYKDLDTFRIATSRPDQHAGPIEFILRRQGLFSWRLSRIALPTDLLANPSVADTRRIP